jgi:hypothetical protein
MKCGCRQCIQWTPSQAKVRADVWKSACNSICMRIKGYPELLKSETIYLQASACKFTQLHSIDRRLVTALTDLYTFSEIRKCN